MLKSEKEVTQAQLKAEKAVLKQLEQQYQQTLKDIDEKIADLLARNDSDMQNVIYQVQYQKQLKAQVQAALAQLQANEYKTISDYLAQSYQDGYVGAMYTMHNQGIPMISPIDQNAVIRALQTDSKLNHDLYTELGIDITKLKKSITSEISRGISSGMLYDEIIRNLRNSTKAPLGRAKTIVRTEAHRIQQASAHDAYLYAKSRGADVVKQWDSTLDGDTRDNHRRLDGQIVELEESFKVGGKSAKYPGDFGDPAEDCNCRCRVNQRAKWALGEDELKVLQERASFFGLMQDNSNAFGKAKSADFSKFKANYIETSKAVAEMGISGKKTIDFSGKYDTIKLENKGVRDWYVKAVSKIKSNLNKAVPIEQQSLNAFNKRNTIRNKARSMMVDEKTAKKLETEHPNKTFEELIASKMERKGITREEAILDIFETATKTNKKVNAELGILE